MSRRRENLLPALWTPDSARFALTEMGNVLHDPIERSTEKNFILLSPKSGGTTSHRVIVRTLYIVMTMNSSVWRPLEFCRRLNRSLAKSSGSQVTAVYLQNTKILRSKGVVWCLAHRVCVISGSGLYGSSNLEGTGSSRTKCPLVSGTFFFVFRLRTCLPTGAGP